MVVLYKIWKKIEGEWFKMGPPHPSRCEGNVEATVAIRNLLFSATKLAGTHFLVFELGFPPYIFLILCIWPPHRSCEGRGRTKMPKNRGNPYLSGRKKTNLLSGKMGGRGNRAKKSVFVQNKIEILFFWGGKENC